MPCIYFCTWITMVQTNVFRVSVVSRRELLLLADNSWLVLVRMIAEPKSQLWLAGSFSECYFLSIHASSFLSVFLQE